MFLWASELLLGLEEKVFSLLLSSGVRVRRSRLCLFYWLWLRRSNGDDDDDDDERRREKKGVRRRGEEERIEG